MTIIHINTPSLTSVESKKNPQVICITIKVTKIETKTHPHIHGRQEQTQMVPGFTALKLDTINVLYKIMLFFF